VQISDIRGEKRKIRILKTLFDRYISTDATDGPTRKICRYFGLSHPILPIQIEAINITAGLWIASSSSFTIYSSPPHPSPSFLNLLLLLFFLPLLLLLLLLLFLP